MNRTKAQLAVVGTATIAMLAGEGAILVTDELSKHKEHNTHSHVELEFPMRNANIGQSMYNISYDQYQKSQTKVSCSAILICTLA